MIYPDDFENKVGFSHIRRILLELCLSPMGRKWVEALSFQTEYKCVVDSLAEVDEMKRIIESGSDIPLNGMYDMGRQLTEIRLSGSWLSAEHLYKLSCLLNQLNDIRLFFSREKEDTTPQWPLLASRFANIETYPDIIKEIDRVVNKYGEIKDDASPLLHDIRMEMRRVQSSMTSVMRRVIDKAVSQGIIDKDTTPSVRDGRLVIPVSAGNKKMITGIVHDESATGKTFFIEPMEVVQTSNRLRELQMDEMREVTSILISTADFIRPNIDGILLGGEIVGHFDFIRAKALLAQKVGGELPTVERKPELDWFHAVHPSLKLTLEAQGREVVPLNINLDNKNRILIISGPNAGGKSVCLKTVGIIQYMLQCGLLPTLYSNSHVGVFRNLFIDIGDEQSFENDLSTYSSHLKNMKHFLRYSNDKTLFLADEMGSGTEPQIGGALAQAILNAINKKRSFGVVTTHYQNLKSFADNEDGFINGAMLYDRQHLKPLFQLAVGSPGSSFALEIARNTGLDSEVIEEAKNIVGSDYVNTDKYMLDIARDRRYWANKRTSVKEKERKLNSLLEDYENKAGDLRKQRAEIIREARREAKEIMSGANARLENAIHDIRKVQADKEKTKAIRAELERYKRELEDKGTEDNSSVPNILKPLNPQKKKRGAQKNKDTGISSEKELMSGDYVKMSDGGVTGQILSIKGNKAEVAFGSLRTFVALDKLKSAVKPKEKPLAANPTISKDTGDDIRRRQLNFKQEIDVRGMRADEAIQAVTYFIDDAVQFSIGRVRILHGTGHGILRQLIRQYLSSNPSVKRAEDEDVRFGGAGITVVTLE